MHASDIIFVVPTRGRPQAVSALADAWEVTGARAELVFAVDDDDPNLSAYQYRMRSLPEHIQMVVGPRLRMVGTLNAVAGAIAPDCEAIGFMGDDHRPRTPCWDQRFAECLSGGTGVVYGNDLLMGAQMPTAVALTSDIVQALGYMVPPTLVHLCADLVWKDWGDRLGRITYLDDVVIEHLHPANGKAELDDGYREANSTERVSSDAAAYYAYRDEGQLDEDVAKLQALL